MAEKDVGEEDNPHEGMKKREFGGCTMAGEEEIKERIVGGCFLPREKKERRNCNQTPYKSFYFEIEGENQIKILSPPATYQKFLQTTVLEYCNPPLHAYFFFSVLVPLLSCLQENNEWVDWQTNVLHERNTVENVYRWTCGRPSALQERMKDSDDDELHEKDYDIAALTNNFSNTLRYSIYKNDDADEVQESLDHDDEGVYFDDESSEVIVSSLRFGDNQDRSCLFTNSDWFAFKEDRINEEPPIASTIDEMDEVDLTDMKRDSNCSDDEVVTGEGDELGNFVGSVGGTLRSSPPLVNKVIENGLLDDPTRSEVKSLSLDAGIFELEAQQAEDLFDDNQLPDWVGWRQPSDIQIDSSTEDDFDHPDSVQPGMNTNSNDTVPNTFSGSTSGGGLTEVEAGTSSFEDDVEFVGVDPEGMERGADGWSSDGRPGGEATLSTRTVSKISEAGMDPGRDVSSRLLEFHEINYWRVEQEAGIVKE
ncbi:hypothetical protein Taro_032648 [Colocasia esculenta]|uniref:Uncharacterized protein n=1 Tax=Colocasia esculenta TaxID=4460 RepID=A0A843VLU5_COLES|nr:hypothetical protein [Colocasia esculenta]